MQRKVVGPFTCGPARYLAKMITRNLAHRPLSPVRTVLPRQTHGITAYGWCRPGYIVTMMRVLWLRLFTGLAWLLPATQAWTQAPAGYPDEAGFRMRTRAILPRLSAIDIRPYGMSESRHPLTGRRAFSWALEGEAVYDAHTGRSWRQPPTGYFGPKQRDTAGRISAFGGDGLKYSLPPLTARLLSDADDEVARGWLSIPGNLRQHYHFTAVNWARFYPLLAEQMGPAWRDSFARYAADYREPLHTDNQGLTGRSLTYVHDLIGQTDQLLGGNDVDGGTENHKVMWRTSALVYADHLGEGRRISGRPLPEAKRQLSHTLSDFARRLLITGNGEWDSDVYYPYTIDGFLNVYDFARDSSDRECAGLVLDYLILTTALKSFDGHLAGAQKRGYLPGFKPGRMEAIQDAFFGAAPGAAAAAGTLILATTAYRPNALITRIGRGDLPLPLSLRVSRPAYQLDRPNAFQESFYRTKNFALGNVQQSRMDNPNQQLLWSLLLRTERGVRGLTGGQPRRLTTSGHSPYTQTVHHQNVLLLLAADTEAGARAFPPRVLDPARVNPWYAADSLLDGDAEVNHRAYFGAKRLVMVPPPDPTSASSLDSFYASKDDAAAAWLLLPRGLEPAGKAGRARIFKSSDCWVVVHPVGEEGYLLDVADSLAAAVSSGKWRAVLRDYRVLVASGPVSGYALEVVERDGYSDLTALRHAVSKRQPRRRSLTLTYRSLSGHTLKLTHRPDRLRPRATVNGRIQDFEQWTPSGTIYFSDLITTGEGRLELRLPDTAWSLDYIGDRPRSKIAPLTE